MLALQRVIKGAKESNLLAVITFINFKKAFYSVHQGEMMRILNAYRIPDRLENAICDMYSGTK